MPACVCVRGDRVRDRVRDGADACPAASCPFTSSTRLHLPHFASCFARIAHDDELRHLGDYIIEAPSPAVKLAEDAQQRHATPVADRDAARRVATTNTATSPLSASVLSSSSSSSSSSSRSLVLRSEGDVLAREEGCVRVCAITTTQQVSPHAEGARAGRLSQSRHSPQHADKTSVRRRTASPLPRTPHATRPQDDAPCHSAGPRRMCAPYARHGGHGSGAAAVAIARAASADVGRLHLATLDARAASIVSTPSARTRSDAAAMVHARGFAYYTPRLYVSSPLRASYMYE